MEKCKHCSRYNGCPPCDSCKAEMIKVVDEYLTHYGCVTVLDLVFIRLEIGLDSIYLEKA